MSQEEEDNLCECESGEQLFTRLLLNFMRNNQQMCTESGCVDERQINALQQQEGQQNCGTELSHMLLMLMALLFLMNWCNPFRRTNNPKPLDGNQDGNGGGQGAPPPAPPAPPAVD